MTVQALIALLSIQIVLGLADNLWHHELTERLPAKRSARVELALHALRELGYGFVFIAIAWWLWHGAWSLALVAVVLFEVLTTIVDFVIEDRTRRLPWLERVFHTVLALNCGALLALAAPVLVGWLAAPTALVPVSYGLWSLLLTACGVGVLAWSARDALAARRHFRPAAWERLVVAPPQEGSKRILITGATGFIGRALTHRLLERGERVVVLTRSREKAAELFGPHVEIVTELGALRADERIDAIVNLAGASIAGRPWTARRRRKLVQSRLDVTSALLVLVGRLVVKPKTWINASAIGYYGVRNDDDCLHEKSPPQDAFQSVLCRRWESAAAEARRFGVKVALLRIGLVLGKDGGALPALARPVRFGVGAVLGSGRQWVSWIHLDDLLELISFVLDQESLAGPLNATAPTPVRHAELMQAIAAVHGRRLWPFAVPAKWLKAALGELAELFVDGQRVTPDRALALGFRFRYATVGAALAAILMAQHGEPSQRNALLAERPEAAAK
jgi:uncharacterized protein (TIGR01777 family)